MAELVVALDYKDGASALSMARELKGVVPWVKVGLELFTAEGPAVISGLKELGFKVFLDLKFFDIPNTVQGAVRSAARLGVDMVNIHALGGERMAKAAMEGCAEGVPSGTKLHWFWPSPCLPAWPKVTFRWKTHRLHLKWLLTLL